MRSALIVVAGLVLLGVLAWGSRWIAGASATTAAKVFIPLWLAVALVNLWMGVQRGYTVAEELPIFLVIFAIPAAGAAAGWWKAAS